MGAFELPVEYREGMLEDLAGLIKIPSRSFPEGGEEGKLQAFMKARMESTGARVRTLEVADVPGCLEHPLWCGPERDYRDRPTVIAEMGPETAPALILMAHSDTVPLHSPEKWSVDPFGGVIKDGRIYGLGAGDDKWGLACILTLMRAFSPENAVKEKRLIFISTVDEENGVGNGLLLLALAGIKAEGALYLDGGQMQVVIGNPGGSNLYLRPGKKADYSPGDFNSHLELLGRACADMSAERTRLFDQPYFRSCRDADKSVVLHSREDASGPYFIIAFYMPPGESREDVREYLEKNVSSALGKDYLKYETSFREPWFEPSLIPARTPLAAYLAESLREETGREPVINIGGKQDSFVFRNHAKIPTVSFGVSRVAVDGFHQPNENILVSDSWQGCMAVYRAVKMWMGR